MTQSTPIWNEDLIARHDRAGPRYTSYPTAPHFDSTFGIHQWQRAMQRSNDAGGPLSLYVHIPFCATVCYYCGCNKIITANHARTHAYLEALKLEITMQAQQVNPSRQVKQLHFGGGTPTYLNDEQLQDLMRHIHDSFHLLPDGSGEYAIEVHPQTVSPKRLKKLRAMGFNRLSLGVQDFNPQVQKAVNRFNSEEEVRTLIAEGRCLGFNSTSVDLIYGLPLQTEAGFAKTVAQVIQLRPDRLSLFNYAHMPHLFKVQKQIDANELPAAAVKLKILHNSIGQLLDAGYVYIGMDHFALPGDDLALAQRQGRLHRNFQGYTTGRECDLLGFGVSSINSLANTYAQNDKDIESYQAKVQDRQLPIVKGYELSLDDQIRRHVINELACHGELQKSQVERMWQIHFDNYFHEELRLLQPFADDGLILINDSGLQVTQLGRLLVRRLCMCFDRYLNQPQIQSQPVYSRII